MTARGLIIAAPSSAAGKTTVTVALLRALRRRGVAVRPAKSGPDYIDPAFHAAAAGKSGPNLDSWAMAPGLLDGLLADAAEGSDLVVVEGAMGLFDGAPGRTGRSGSAADLAARYGLPVILVVDVTGQSQTAAAIARGLTVHDPAVRVAGAVLNRVASERHRAAIAEAFAAAGISLFGAIPRDAASTLPSRHLGLVQAGEHADLETRLERLADLAEKSLDLDAIVAAAVPIGGVADAPLPALPPPGQRIALAADAAFTFVYPHLLAGWRRAGAEIAMFSPLADEPPPDDCDCCWLPGGYPELHAGALAGAQRFAEGLRRFAGTRPVHGECGGYMVLGIGLEDAEGKRHAMTGLLGHTTSFATRRLTLGYREARLLSDSPIGPRGAVIRGHEFHYSTLTEERDGEPLAELFDGQGQRVGLAGSRRGAVTGTFFHAIARE